MQAEAATAPNAGYRGHLSRSAHADYERKLKLETADYEREEAAIMASLPRGTSLGRALAEVNRILAERARAA